MYEHFLYGYCFVHKFPCIRIFLYTYCLIYIFPCTDIALYIFCSLYNVQMLCCSDIAMYCTVHVLSSAYIYLYIYCLVQILCCADNTLKRYCFLQCIDSALYTISCTNFLLYKFCLLNIFLSIYIVL